VRRRRLLVLSTPLIAVAALVLATAGPPKPLSTPPGTFAFGATGDSPYLPWEDLQYPLVTQELDGTDLAFVVHVGDIFWRPCSDAHYRTTRARFDRSRHPLFYTPGDNEWADCWEPGSGGFLPLDRLDSIRRIFFDEPRVSFGAAKLSADTQADDPAFATFPENVRWTHRGVVFATVHLVGSWNATRSYPGRTKAEDAAAHVRTEAAAAWMRAAFLRARETAAPAVVILFHGNPNFESPAGDRGREPYEPFLTALVEEAERFGRPVLVVHGDEHIYLIDHPIRAKNLTRMQVPGSPLVAWVRVVVDPRARDPFSFDEHVVPRWKYW